MENKSSMTALISAFARSYHTQNNNNPIFIDNFAEKLFSLEEYEKIKKYISDGIDFFAPGQNFATKKEALDFVVDNQLAPTPLARSRYCEESLKNAVLTGTTQYVILGSGMDTFAWRQPALMEKLTVYEVDHPLTQKDKLRRIDNSGLKIPKKLHFVSVDFSRDNLKEELIKKGFDTTQKTFFSWLGVSYYLSADEISDIFGNIEAFASEGSTVLFDYADSGLFNATEKRVQNTLSLAQASKEPIKFCSDEAELSMLLDKHHFIIYEHLSPEEINRFFFKNRNDGMKAFEHICYATAVLKGTPFIDTKEKILQNALKLFSERGYEAVSVKDIADRLSLTKAALYKHYQNKRDILNKIVSRMEEEDAKRSAAFCMPVNEYNNNPEEYRKTQLKNIICYTQAQFYYWTENTFASRFRKMLTLEQYHDSTMQKLYQQYLCNGPLSYMTDIFSQIISDPEKAEQTALDFYAPVFMLYSVYDGADDKNIPIKILKNHLNFFKIKI